MTPTDYAIALNAAYALGFFALLVFIFRKHL
jgi:hypothetical protein